MMSNYKLSIVVPIYNKEEYLAECLDSILGQTMSDIEVVCINDGSTDGSGKILDEYARKDSRIKVRHKNNEGVVQARKDGVAMATSPIIGFVDSDDWVEPDMFKTLYKYMMENELDIVSSGLYKGNNIFSDNYEPGIYSTEEQLQELFSNLLMTGNEMKYNIRAYAVTKLFRRELLLCTIRDIDNRIHFREDDCVVYSYLVKCRRIGVIKEAFYHYRYVEGSTVHSVDEFFLGRINLVYLFLKNQFVDSPYAKDLVPQLQSYIAKTVVMGTNFWMGFGAEAAMDADLSYQRIKDDETIVIYGAGDYGKRMLELLKSKKEVVAFVDKKANEPVDGIPVLRLEGLKHIKYDKIVIAVQSKKTINAIRIELMNMGIDGNVIINLW